MKNMTVQVPEKNSVVMEESGIIISVQHISGSECKFVAGYPGVPNVAKDAKTGDALLLETPNLGIFEIRLLKNTYVDATFLVTHISPRLGIAGSLGTEDPLNTPFSADELQRISVSLESVKKDIRGRLSLQIEQYELIDRKIDEIVVASERLGRKDWLNYTAGALTSLCITAAFDVTVTKSIFSSIGSALRWLFTNAPHFLP